MTKQAQCYDEFWLRDRAATSLHLELPREARNASLPAIRSDHDLNGYENASVPELLLPAAVVMAMEFRNGELQVLLTQRSDELPTHPGQISFPGGKIDPGDPGPVECALREMHEETGIATEFVEPLGFLDVYQTRTGFRVVPIVALLRPGYELVPEPGEVTDIFMIPLRFFMDPANHQRHSRIWQGKRRYFYAMPYGERYVWGATAGMLRNFYDRMGTP
jgi:8-oxo-dGTP pyrophosphatase MutT (NUDIX family)